jgi:hypothetical protein
MENGILKFDFSVLLLCALCVSVVSPEFLDATVRAAQSRERRPERRFQALRACFDATGECDSGATARGESHHVDDGQKS